MGRRIDVWVADDDTRFESELDMLLYELSKVDEKEIELFLANEYKMNARKKKEYTTVLMAWQKYIREQNISSAETQKSIESPKVDLSKFYQDQEKETREWKPPVSPLLADGELPDDGLEESFKKAVRV